MSTPTKLLKINPQLFSSKNNLSSTNKNTTFKKREKNGLVNKYKGPTTLRKALLGKIKEFQNKEKMNDREKTDESSNNNNNSNNSNNTNELNINDDFNKTLGFLKSLSNKKSEKNRPSKINNISISSSLLNNNSNNIKPNKKDHNIIELILDKKNNNTNKQNNSEKIKNDDIISVNYEKKYNTNTNNTNTNNTNTNNRNTNNRNNTITNNTNIIGGNTSIFKKIDQNTITNIPENQQLINLELPNELKEDIYPSNDIFFNLKDSLNNTPISNNNFKFPNFLNDPIIKYNKNNIQIENTNNDVINNDVINNDVINNKQNVTIIEPPYSNLKGGNKPTYKEWNRQTLKKSDYLKENTKINIEDYNKFNEQSERSNRLNDLKYKYSNKNTNNSSSINSSNNNSSSINSSNNNSSSINSSNNSNSNNSNNSNSNNSNNSISNKNKKLLRLKKIKTRTIKYNLGKRGKTVSILLKNNETQRKVKHEISLLRKKPIRDIKQYLRDKNLIKAGTIAPTNILREIFEQSILSGDLTNRNNNVLFHNFISDEN
jgi:hypothetical protein